MNTLFFSGQVFLKGEKFQDYKWLFATIKSLYKHVDIPLLIVWLSDGELNTSAAIAEEISPTAKHALCVWHLEQNILDNCKKYFPANETWFEFFGGFDKEIKKKTTGELHRLLYVDNQSDFDLIWQELQDKYNSLDERICLYLEDNLLPKKKKWCKIWTDLVMHFGQSTTSTGESSNALLKKELTNSQGDLKTAVDASNITCDRQRNNYIQALGNAKQRLDHKLRAAIYRDLGAYVTPFALREVQEQYKRLLTAEEKNVSLPACTETFKRVMGLPSAHVIEERRADSEGGGVLKLADVHPHWRFKKPNRHYREPEEFVNVDEEEEDDTPAQDPLLQIQNPKTVPTKGRPRGSQNRNKSKATRGRNRAEEQQRAFDNSTRRESSRFEYTEAIDLTSSVQVPASQPPPSSQPSFMRPPPIQNIRPPTSYPEPSMFESSSTPYFQQPSPFDPPPSAQSLPSQVYSQWPNHVYSQPISTPNNSTTT